MTNTQSNVNLTWLKIVKDILKEEGVLKKITEAELGYSSDGHFKKGISFSPEITFFFDEYTVDYTNTFARFLLRNKTTNIICEIIEYTIPTFLQYKYTFEEIDLVVSLDRYIYFYNNNKLVCKSTYFATYLLSHDNNICRVKDLKWF